jgi:hypothetical protein
MKIYKISQSINNDYDTYDSAIVYAESEEDARGIHPDGTTDPNSWIPYPELNYDWVDLPEHIKVEYIGEAPHITEKSVILASFNAG